MKLRILSLLIVLLAINNVVLSQSPVQWNFSSKKIANGTYEVMLKANVNGSWHIYSQTTPEGGPLPTKIAFSKNPLIDIEGDAKENGKLIQKHEEVFGIDVKYFEGEVAFVQTVKLKANTKTNLKGTVEFMVCNDVECLPPTSVPFSVALQ